MKALSVGRVLKESLLRQWRMLGALLAVVVTAMVLEAVPPLVLQRLIDRHLAVGLISGIWSLALVYLLAIFAQRAVIFAQNYCTTVIGQDILHRLRLSLAQHFRDLPLRYFDATPVGDIMSRATADVEAVNTLFTSGVVSVLADTLRVVGVLAAMFSLNVRLTWVSMLVIPIILVITEYFRRHIRRAERTTRLAVGRINSTFQESLSGMRVIHTFGQEQRFQQVLGGDLSLFLGAVSQASLYNSFFPPAMDLLRGSLTVALLWVGISSQGQGAISIGVLVAFLQLVTRLFSPLTALSDEYQTIQQALAGVERINEVLMQPAEERPSWTKLPEQIVGEVVIDQLHFGYSSERPILHDLNLRVSPGERVAIVGRTGAGKTSLLNLLAGVYAPWSGTITIDGVDPRRIPPEQRRKLLGVVPQTIQLFDGSISDNITLGDASISREAVVHTAQIVGLHEFISSLPERYDTYLGSGGTRLSHGQQQLLSLARALVLDPAVLLLDEPTSGLDADTEQRLYAAIRAESSKRTTITISHRLSGVMDAERVIVMAGGQIVQDGTPDQLAQEDGWYAMMRALESLGWQSEVVVG